jgi:hypothetical protein
MVQLRPPDIHAGGVGLVELLYGLDPVKTGLLGAYAIVLQPGLLAHPVQPLLDECVPRRFRRELPHHEVRTVPEMGWAAKENGELLRLAESRFDVLITADQKLKYQQSVSGRNIAVP